MPWPMLTVASLLDHAPSSGQQAGSSWTHGMAARCSWQSLGHGALLQALQNMKPCAGTWHTSWDHACTAETDAEHGTQKGAARLGMRQHAQRSSPEMGTETEYRVGGAEPSTASTRTGSVRALLLGSCRVR